MRALMLCLVFPVLLLVFDVSIKADSISGILGLLVGIAGAIFTIMSIWVAFLYPNVLRTIKGENLVNVEFHAGGEDTSRLKEVVSVIIQSALTMTFAVLLMVSNSVVENFPFRVQAVIGQINQFVLLYFCGIQVCALASTIWINVSFIGALDKYRKKRARDWDV